MYEKLKQLGYTDDEIKKIQKVFDEHLDGNYVTKDRFNSVNEDNKNLKNNLKERDAQLDTLKKSAGDNQELKDQIEKLKKENKENADKFAQELKASKTKAAVKNKLGNQVFDSDMVIGLMDLAKIELDENDNVKSGFDDQFNNLKKSKAFLFKPEQQKNQFRFEGASSIESNKDSGEGNKGQTIGSKLADMKLGTNNGNEKAVSYYFNSDSTKK